MAIDMQPHDRIVLVRFTDVTNRGVFSDVLRFTDAEYTASTAASRRALAVQVARFVARFGPRA